jgi:hypothetical protein
MEVTVNVQAFAELKRVLSNVPQARLNVAHWDACACGHATRDAWFQSRGFTRCTSFDDAVAFFGIPRPEAIGLFSGGSGVTPGQVIRNIDHLLANRTNEQNQAAAQNTRRQAIIDDLFSKANKAAVKARRVATAALIGVFF